MHLICLKAFVNFHKETLFKNTLFYGNKLYVVEFFKRNQNSQNQTTNLQKLLEQCPNIQ